MKYCGLSFVCSNAFDAFQPAVLSNFFMILANPVLFNAYSSKQKRKSKILWSLISCPDPPSFGSKLAYFVVLQHLQTAVKL